MTIPMISQTISRTHVKPFRPAISPSVDRAPVPVFAAGRQVRQGEEAQRLRSQRRVADLLGDRRRVVDTALRRASL